MRILLIILLLNTACNRGGLFSNQKNYFREQPPGTVHLKDNLYIDRNEIGNVHYREFIFWLAREDSAHYDENLPDTLVWRNTEEEYNEYYVGSYFRHPAVNFYPVVGISYEQALAFCNWRTKMVNEGISRDKKRKYKKVRYRLPTREEWELASSGGLDPEVYPFGMENVQDKKGNLNIYCSLNHMVRDSLGFNFSHTENLQSYFRNRYGMYHLAGNVSEMIQEKGIAKGGNYRLALDSCKIKLDHVYTKPENWLGFRCICEVIE